MILGIDEVGRGSWAGPLVVGAVVLGGVSIDGINDSKKLSKNKRIALDIEIREKAHGFALGWVNAVEIDKIGLSNALKLATIRAVEQITVSYHEIIIDGTVNFLSGTSKEQYVTTIKKADQLIPSVSAASIIAKVARDNFMAKQDEIYAGYNFKSHVGYGTKEHRNAIEQLGVNDLHRLSFTPLNKYKTISKIESIVSTNKTAKSIGNIAENIAADYLINIGHEILNRNWKNKFCEIDIVSKYFDTIYFTEVKYREKSNHGDGIVAITPKKFRQMEFAVKFYTTSNRMSNKNLRLAVISLSDNPPKVQEYLEI